MEIILKVDNKNKEELKNKIDKSLKILWEYFRYSMEEYENQFELDSLYNILDIFRDYKIK